MFLLVIKSTTEYSDLISLVFKVNLFHVKPFFRQSAAKNENFKPDMNVLIGARLTQTIKEGVTVFAHDGKRKSINGGNQFAFAAVVFQFCECDDQCEFSG
jgi:hypothetical protein